MPDGTMPPSRVDGKTDSGKPVAMMTRGELAELVDERLAARERLPHRRLYRPEEVGEAIGCSARKVYSLLDKGLPCVRVGCQRRIDLDRAIEWLEQHGAAVGR